MSVSAGRKAAVSEELRTRLVALANELVPEAEGMPAAGAVANRVKDVLTELLEARARSLASVDGAGPRVDL